MEQYIFGKNAVNIALKNDSVSKLFLKKGNKEYDKYRIRKEFVDLKVLDKLSNQGNHQGVVACVEGYKTKSLDYIISKAKSKEYPLILLLDGLTDPHNLGAILRIADAIGVDGVIYGKHRSVSLNATVAKVSTGAIETVDVCEVTNLTQTLKTLKDNGYWIIGTDLTESKDYRAVDYKMSTVLVIGSEGEGISRLVKKECDYLVKLPMYGTVQSLNASVATGILCYQINNNRYPQ